MALEYDSKVVIRKMNDDRAQRIDAGEDRGSSRRPSRSGRQRRAGDEGREARPLDLADLDREGKAGKVEASTAIRARLTSSQASTPARSGIGPQLGQAFEDRPPLISSHRIQTTARKPHRLCARIGQVE